MKLTTKLEEVHKAVSLCIKASMCTHGDWPENSPVCPLYLRGRSYTASPGGLVYILRALLDGNTDYSQSLAELAFTCAGCGACDEFCQLLPFPSPHAGPWDMIRLLRHRLVERGLVPEGKVKELYEAIRKNGDYMDKGEGINLTVPEEIRDDKASTILFAECFHNDAQRGIYEAALRLLKKLEQPIYLFSDGGCCGSTLYDLGFWKQLGKLVETKWEKLSDLGDKEFLFINPHCQEFVVKRYPEILPTYTGIKARHFSEFLLDAFKLGKLKNKKLGKTKVSYHDPCYLGRGLGIYDAPRETLKFIDGVQLVEIKGNRRNSLCCGARAKGNYLPTFSEKNAKIRIEAFREAGADLLITCCPYCKETFQNVMPNNEKGRIKDLIEFVEERTEEQL